MDAIATTKTTNLASRFVTVSIGKKVLMAVSGVVLLGFITGHMIGNLQLFIGQGQLNTYAAALQGLGNLLYLIRGFLFLMLVLHVWTAIKLKMENLRARPESYKSNRYQKAGYSSRSMIWTGAGLFLFLIYHLLHYTFIVTNPEYHQLTDSFGHRDVYSMLILGFSNVWISLVYIVAMAIISLHLAHAVVSMFQTLGWNDQRTEPILHKLSFTYAWIIFLGYASMPIAVLAGLLKLPGGGII